jgi:hypothetical protein
MKKRYAAIGAAALMAAAAASVVGTGKASAAPVTVTATTQVSNHPENPTWAYDDFARTLTVSADSTATDCAALTGFVAVADTCYKATVADTGQFHAILGALSPNQSTAGVKISHSVSGSMTGGASYVLYAPVTDTPSAANIESTQDDNFTAPTVVDHKTSDWPAQAFATPSAVVAAYTNGGNGWSWTYKTQAETWIDGGTTGAGELPGNGNITGKINPVPYVYAGHVIVPDTTGKATVGWSESANGWPNPANKCEEVWIYGYGFTTSSGGAHIGFTCDNGAGTNRGYLWGLSPAHNYALVIVPAEGTYGNHHQIPGTDARAHVYVYRTR